MKKGHINLISEESSDNSFQLRSPSAFSSIKRKLHKIYSFRREEINLKFIKKYIRTNLKNIICFFIFIICYYLYYLSIERCYEGNDGCVKKMRWIALKVVQEVISCIIVSILFELMFYKIISKLHLIHFAIAFIFFYQYSHGMDFDDHGYFNFIAYFIIVSVLLLFILPINGFIYFYRIKNKKYVIYYITSILVITFIIFLFLHSDFVNCKEWPMGLNKTAIENDKEKYGCQIVIPSICLNKILYKFQDMTKIKRINCQKSKKNAKKKIIEKSNSPYLNENFTRVGFPWTNKDPICLLDYEEQRNIVSEYFLSNIVDMNNKEILDTVFKDKMPEIEVDFSNNINGEMIINVYYNKTLSEERKAREKNANPYSNNILFLYIDSVSRVNSIRQLKKTLNFFERFMPYEGGFNPDFPSEIFHSFQFFKYYSFKYFTSENFPPMFYGRRSLEKNLVLINKYLKENGYVTGYVGDYCKRDNVRTFHNMTTEEIHDHQFISCDPSSGHYNVNFVKCLYGKHLAEHLYEYGNQFWRKYKDNRKFLTIVTNDGHEGTLQVIKYIDGIIYEFLNNLFKDNLLKDTLIFLISDHGTGVPSIYYIQEFYKIEMQLPMLYILVNDRKNVSYDTQYKNIHKNQQTFITVYDVYNTIGNIIYGDEYSSIANKTEDFDTPKSEKGESLFNAIDQKSRKPDKYEIMSHESCK